MKLHTLKSSWLAAAMLAAVALGEFIAWEVSRAFHVRFYSVAAAALSIGLVAALVSWIYDGDGNE